MLVGAAKLLHDNNYYNAVAHAAYYSCYQMLMCIWLYSMGKSQDDLTANTSQSTMGSHEYLLNEVYIHIAASSREDARIIKNDMPQLKRLRTDADYKDTIFDSDRSRQSMELSSKLLSILKRY